MNSRGATATLPEQLEKSPTGIKGLDDLTFGGLPSGRSTIVCGGPGSGKSLLAVEFLVRGIREFDEPGALLTFEENATDMARNVAALGFHLEELQRRKKLFVDHVYVEPSGFEETGEYDLEGLFVRLQHAVDSVKAKRVVLDTLEAVFLGFRNTGILRAEIRRLFRWLKDRGLTTVVTAERGENTLTRHGLEEYISDCVLVLDHRVSEQLSTRRLRVVKYRGSAHGSDEVPFLIDASGFSVLPVSSLQLAHPAPTDRVPSGIPELDGMLGGQGYYRASSILVSGGAGSGKSSIVASLAAETCRRGERCLYIALEESPAQAARNMRSIGIDLEAFVKRGRLRLEAWRPAQHGIEKHLLRIHALVDEFRPDVVIIDPITQLVIGSRGEVHSLLTRLIDFLKMRAATACFTTLSGIVADDRVDAPERSGAGVSSLIDTWIVLRDVEVNGERNRCLHIVKSRGMAHSNQLREFVLSGDGIRLLPVYIGSAGVLTGSARLAQAVRERAEAVQREQEITRSQLELEQRRTRLEAQIVALRAEFAAEEQRLEREILQARAREERLLEDEKEMAASRAASSVGADGPPAPWSGT